MSAENFSGYLVAYEQEELQFPVYLLALAAAVFFLAGIYKDLPVLMGLALVPLFAFFYNLPLLETGRPRMGAGQYGFFLEGLGLIQWRAIDGLELVGRDERGALSSELRIELKVAVDQALILDWRRQTPVRRLMRLPWSWASKRTIRIPLDIMDKPPPEIHATILRLWRFYRGQDTPPVSKTT